MPERFNRIHRPRESLLSAEEVKPDFFCMHLYTDYTIYEVMNLHRPADMDDGSLQRYAALLLSLASPRPICLARSLSFALFIAT